MLPFLATILAACTSSEEVRRPPAGLGERASVSPPVGAAWTLDSAVAEAWLGGALATGDVDGDGFEDLIVGASDHEGGQRGEGAVFVFPGSRRGPSAVATWSVEGDADWVGLGASVAAADVNGDGFDDVIVGARGYSDGEMYEGGAFVYLGSRGGPSPQPDWLAEGGQAYAWLGGAVASAGDVDADGYEDVVIGAPGQDTTAADAGRVALYRGSASGLELAPSWAVDGELGSGNLGTAVAAGDVDGDGFSDVAVGAESFGEGRVALVYRGSAAGLSADPAWTAAGVGSARALAAADVDGDGDDDLLVGDAWTWGERRGGLAWLYRGTPGGLEPEPVWGIEAVEAYEDLGGAVASASDVNADGFEDVLVASPALDGALPDVGSATLFLGSAAGLRSAAVVFGGDEEDGWLGWALAAGDLDGDGFDDLVLGEPGSAAGGSVSTYAGRALPDRDRDAAYDVEDLCPDAPDPHQLDADADGLGNACDEPTLAVVGVVSTGAPITLVAAGVAPGEVVAFAGAPGSGGAGPCPAALGGTCLDLGPGAVALGTAVTDATGSASLATVFPAAFPPGGAYVVQVAVARGGSSVTSAVLVLDGAVLDWDADGVPDATEAALGTDPTDPDTDGDGLDDGVELAPHLDPLSTDADGDGVPDPSDVCLAGDDADDPDLDGLASACELCPADADPGQEDTDADGLGDSCEGEVLVEDPWSPRSNQAEARLGAALASGDLNADGWPDVIAGAPGWDGAVVDEGAVVVWLGSSAGLPAAPSWTALGGVEGASFGAAVAAADVDGDGFDDVVVGAPAHDDGLGGLGEIRVFQGSAAGPAAPSWTVHGDAASGALGWGVGGADVDGDGFDDLVLSVASRVEGQPDGARVFLGSPGGLQPSAAWAVDADDVEGRSASYAAPAGDVNGDGFEDVAFGTWGYVVGDWSVGRVSVFHGSAAGLPEEPSWTLLGEAGRSLGGIGAPAGDVNGDGFGDLATDRHLLMGSPTGLGGEPVEVHADTWQAAAAGDVDGDGFGDLLVADTRFTGGEESEGAAFLHLGSAGGLAPAEAWRGESDQAASDWTRECTFNPESGVGVCGYYWANVADYGRAVAAAGDVDGDGLGDVLVGAPGYDEGQEDEGRVFLYRGAAP